MDITRKTYLAEPEKLCTRRAKSPSVLHSSFYLAFDEASSALDSRNFSLSLGSRWKSEFKD
jgi:hypothetical protein